MLESEGALGEPSTSAMLNSRLRYVDSVQVAGPSKIDLAFLERAKQYMKRLEAQALPKEEAGRNTLWKILRALSEQMKFELPYPIVEGRKARTHFELGLNIQYFAAHPYLFDLLFSSLVPPSYRKRIGQFTTPAPISQFMALWGTRRGCDLALDPGVGTGILLESVNRHSPCSLVGFDIDPLALNLTALRLKLVAPQSTIDLHEEDFLATPIRPLDADLVISNPPYLNFHDFDIDKVVKGIEKKSGTEISKLTNIYALFFYQACYHLREGGSLTFITPSEFLYTGYGSALKAFLLGRFSIHAFLLTDFEKLAFEEALTTSVISLLTKEKPVQGHKVKFVRISEWPDTNDLMDLVEGRRGSLSGCQVHEVLQSALKPTNKWQMHFGDNGMMTSMRNLVPLSQLASVNRGIATGSNSYFALSRDEAKEWDIEERFLAPVISKSLQAPHYNYTKVDYEKDLMSGAKSLLLYCFEEPSRNLRNYIKHGEEAGIDKRFLTSHRSPWYSSEKQSPPPVLACVFSRERMRFILNEAGVRSLTTFHGVYPKFSDPILLKALLAFLNSGFSAKVQELMRREYGGGLHKFEPRDLEELLVLDITKVSIQSKTRLASLFDELCEASREGETGEKVVKSKIDRELSELIRSS